MAELKRITYVEDEPDVRTVAILALEQIGGFTLDVCGSGREAVERAPAFRPDLILLDVMMPRMDGIEGGSPVTRDLLQLILAQRGHRVDILEDGAKALEALRSGEYDVALIDFHLPVMDGLEVVAGFLAAGGRRRRPLFVAMTADVEGLLAHAEDCERFDRIVAKPIDVHEITEVGEAGPPASPTSTPRGWPAAMPSASAG